MSIQPVIAAALELQERLLPLGLPFCFVGGLAVQRWGEPRLTVDADATVLTSWEQRVILPRLRKRMRDHGFRV